MSLFIQGMEIPKCCYDCELIDVVESCPNYQTPSEDFAAYKWIKKTRHKDCPLVEVKLPHGRLIDGDAVKSRTVLINGERQVVPFLADVWDAPTVIESEGV